MKKRETLEQKLEVLLGYLSELNNSEEIDEIKSILEEIKSNTDNEDVIDYVDSIRPMIESALGVLSDIESDLVDNLYYLALEKSE